MPANRSSSEFAAAVAAAAQCYWNSATTECLPGEPTAPSTTPTSTPATTGTSTYTTTGTSTPATTTGTSTLTSTGTSTYTTTGTTTYTTTGTTAEQPYVPCEAAGCRQNISGCTISYCGALCIGPGCAAACDAPDCGYGCHGAGCAKDPATDHTDPTTSCAALTAAFAKYSGDQNFMAARIPGGGPASKFATFWSSSAGADWQETVCTHPDNAHPCVWEGEGLCRARGVAAARGKTTLSQPYVIATGAAVGAGLMGAIGWAVYRRMNPSEYRRVGTQG